MTMAMKALMVVACFGAASAIHSVAQIAEIESTLAAIEVAAKEGNYGCSVEENLEAFQKLVGEKSNGWSEYCTLEQYTSLMDQDLGETGTGNSVFTVPIRFALKNPTHDESSSVSASSYVFSYGPVPARVEAGFEVKVPSTSTAPSFMWYGNVHEDHICANRILRTIYDLDHGHIDYFESCKGRDPVVSLMSADLSHRGHPKWLADCGGLKDAPETNCLKNLMFCKTQECIDTLYGYKEIGHGMKSRNRACSCTITQTENIAPPKPIPATCDTMPVPQGWLRCDNAEADCNCPVGWDDPDCESTGYGNGMSCRCTCYDRHRECIEAGDSSIINCLDTVCTENDIDTCMIMIPVWCDSAVCPPGWIMKPDAGDIQCAGMSIKDGGQGHTECEMSIGIGEVNMFKNHGATDTSTCCNELAKCKNGVAGHLFGGKAVYATGRGRECSAHNKNGDIYEPLCTERSGGLRECKQDTTGDGEFDTIYCPTINQTSCLLDICCKHSQCQPVENCIGKLGCMSPESESSCSSCAPGYFGSKCTQCPTIDNAAAGATYTCAGGLKDLTMVTGHCIEGFYHQAGGAKAADSCEECPHVEGCMLNFVSCGNAHSSICAKCKGGWSGDKCQHEPVFEDVDMTVCSGKGQTEDPFRLGLSTCVGGGCAGEKWMVQGTQVGPHERWVKGDCTYYPAGKMRGLEALIKQGQSDDIDTEGDDWVPANADYAGPANDHIDADGNAFQKRRRLAAQTMAEAAATSVLTARRELQSYTTTPAPVISDETIAENAKQLELADEAIKAEDAHEHEVARETQAADAKRAEMVKEQALAAETNAEAMARAAEQLRLKLLEDEAAKPREGTCMCGGPNDVWEGLPGIGEFEDATCLTYFQGEAGYKLCSDPDVECGDCVGTCRVLPPTEPCECDDGYSGEDCESSAHCPALTDDDVHFPAVISNCPDDAAPGSFCEIGCAEGYYLIQKSDGYCTADAGGATASYKGANVNCRLCNTLHHCLGHEDATHMHRSITGERRLATGFQVHARRLSGEKGLITCSNPEDSVCSECAPGYSGPKCEPCPLGKFMADGSLQCKDCDAGQYTSVEGSTDCRGCEAGEHVEGVACVKCEAGKFSTETNQEHCVDCDAHNFSSGEGNTECTACEAGTYQKNAGRTKCHDCTPMENCAEGLTCTNNRNSVCETCDGGHFPSKDQKECKGCVQAEHCQPDSSVCDQAGEHEQGLDRDRSTCTDCLPGFYIDGAGICLKCEAVERCVADMETCTTQGDSTCLECEVGWMGDLCTESELDTDCFTQDFKYPDDGLTDPPTNDGTTHPLLEHTYFGCQMECKKDAKCELFSYNTDDESCALHAADAGCADEACAEAASTKVSESGTNGMMTEAPGWVAGPKSCNLATCDTMICPEGWWLDMEFIYSNAKGATRSAIRCQREECGEVDIPRCCVPAVCGEYTCDPDHIARPGVEALTCSDREGKMRDEVVQSISGDDALNQFAPACTGEDDKEMCCEPKAKCDSYECPSGFTHKRDGLHVSKKNCQGAVCTEEADLDSCCDGLATCESFKCPVSSKAVDEKTGKVRNIDFLARPEPNTIFCRGMECDDSWDRDTCCAQRAECVDMECPSGYVNSEWAIRTEIACEGITCTEAADLDRCCYEIVYCDTMISTGEGAICPDGYSPKHDLTSIACDSTSGRCDPRIDVERCCDEQEQCDEMSPVLFDCAALNNDFGPDCDGQCIRETCEAKASYGCAFAFGPPEMPWNEYHPKGTPDDPSLDDEDEPIGTGACGWAECHREWHDCVCPHGEDQWGDDEQMEGAFFPSGIHENYITGYGWFGPIDKFSGECKDVMVQGELVSTALSGDGNSEKCSEGFTQKLDPKDTNCAGPWCTLADDFETCCVKQASCDTLTDIPAGHALKPQAYDFLCNGEFCDPSVDLPNCCDVQAPCSDMTCPSGSAQKEGEHLCSGGVCEALVDADVCCDLCAAGTFAANDGDDCTDCDAGKYSEMGYHGVGSVGCLDCGDGKFSDAGVDHCLDCSPIFACSEKDGLYLDAQPAEPPQADYMMMPFNTAGCANTGGNIDTEQVCANAAEYLGMTYATDGSNVVENGPANCFSLQGREVKFARNVDASLSIDTLAPLCVGGGDADGQVGHGVEIITHGLQSGQHEGSGFEVLETHDAERAAAMVADVVTEAPEFVARRRLAAAFRAAVAIHAASESSNNVQCSSADDAVCSKCHIGYFGSTTNACTRCEKMENCKYGLGHKMGVSCDSATGEQVPETCGECKEGFFPPYCTGCTRVDGCVEDSESCSTDSDTKCGKCAPGYYPDESNGTADSDGQMDVCHQCVVIPQCTKAFCTNGDNQVCLECAFGYYPAGSRCAAVIFDDALSIFTYELGGAKDVMPEIFDDVEHVCSSRVTAEINEKFEEMMGHTDPANLPQIDANARKTAKMCTDAGCDPEMQEVMGLATSVKCFKPKKAAAGLLKML